MNAQETIFITGATGFIGSALVQTLLGSTTNNQRIILGMRDAVNRKADYLRILEQALSFDSSRIEFVEYDLSADNTETLRLLQQRNVVLIYHLAAAFSWGLSQAQGQRQNVGASEALLETFKNSSTLRRFIWIGGYRTAKDKGEPADKLYRQLGAYEASKFIAHRRIIELADQYQIPWTALNPASVIGHSETGETCQFIGISEMVEQLYLGKLPMLPGNRETFLPLVHVDFVARFAAAIPQYKSAIGQQYSLLDENTPTLANLMSIMAEHMGVVAPTGFISPAILRRIPQALLPTTKETLSFISTDRYDTSNTKEMADTMGLGQLLAVRNIGKWLDALVRQNFGKHQNAAPTGRYKSHTWLHINQVKKQKDQEPLFVGLHGLPLEGSSLSPLFNKLGRSAVAPDLPGLGHSGSQNILEESQSAAWLGRLLPDSSVVLVGHSYGTGIAIDYARRFPDKVDALVLISPYFLQQRAGWPLRHVMSARLLLLSLSDDALAKLILKSDTEHPAVLAALNARKRPNNHKQIAAYMAHANNQTERDRQRSNLNALNQPVLIITGANDPLMTPALHKHEIIKNTGHNPHLSHSDEVASHIEKFLSRLGAAAQVRPSDLKTRSY